MDDDLLSLTEDLALPRSEITFRFARSSGPGGQHVNKSETQVELLWDVRHSPTLDEKQRLRLVEALAHRIDEDGVLHLTSGQTRSQEQNRQAVIARLARLVAAALKPQRPRVATTVSKAARTRRLAEKKRRGEIKRGRRSMSEEL